MVGRFYLWGIYTKAVMAQPARSTDARIMSLAHVVAFFTLHPSLVPKLPVTRNLSIHKQCRPVIIGEYITHYRRSRKKRSPILSIFLLRSIARAVPAVPIGAWELSSSATENPLPTCFNCIFINHLAERLQIVILTKCNDLGHQIKRTF